MSVEKIIERIPDPKAVEELIAAARDIEADRDRLRELLREWDSLIKYQYSGSREAMSALAMVAQKTVKALAKERP